MQAVGLSNMALIMLWYVPFMPTLWKVFFFIINRCWILSKAFSASIEKHLTFGFQFCVVCVVYYMDWFADIEPFFDALDKTYFNMVSVPFNVLMNSVC